MNYSHPESEKAKLDLMDSGLPRVSVMQIIYSLRVGGSEKLALAIASNINPNQFKSSVCALDLDGELAKDLERLQMDFHVMHRRGIELGIFRKLYQLIKRNRINVVHTHHFGQLLYAALPARLAGARIVHTEHEFFTYMTSRFSRAMIRPLARLCDAITVVGPEVAEYFVQKIGVCEAQMRVVPNGVDVTKFECDPQAVREELGLSPQEVVIGTVGRLEPEKDQKTLLELFLRVRTECPEVRLLIVGNGGMADELKSHAKRIGVSNYTLFLGSRPDVPRLLAAMDVFVLTSVREGLPISLIEAMAARKPVVASNIGSIKALVRHGENGFLVPPRDISAFGDAVFRLIKSPKLRENFGKEGRHIVEVSFSLSSMIREYECLYNSVLGKTHVWN